MKFPFQFEQIFLPYFNKKIVFCNNKDIGKKCFCNWQKNRQGN